MIVRHIVDNWNLFPDKQSEAVGGIKDSGTLWIMREAHEVGAHVLDNLHIATVHLVAEGHTYGFHILMAAHTSEFQWLAIEQETSVGIKTYSTERGMDYTAVGLVALSVHSHCLNGIEVRRIGTPENRFTDSVEMKTDILLSSARTHFLFKRLHSSAVGGNKTNRNFCSTCFRILIHKR